MLNSICNSMRDPADELVAGDIVIHKSTDNFLIMHGESLDSPMSLEAKGLLCWLMKRPKTWRINVNHMVKELGKSKNTIYKIINELIEHGYIQRVAIRSQKGRGKFEEFSYRAFDQSIRSVPKFWELNENTGNIESSSFPKNSEMNNSLMNNCDAYKKRNNIKKDNIKKQQQFELGKSIKITPPNNYLVIDEKPAAAKYLNLVLQEQDLIIKDELTVTQEQCVEEALKRISELKKREEVKFALLSQKHFTAAENDFVKKLNTIKKVIRNGEWKKPAGMINAKEKAKQKESDEKAQKIRILEAEKNHAKYMIESFKDNISDPRSKKFHECWSIRFNEAEQKIKNLME